MMRIVRGNLIPTAEPDDHEDVHEQVDHVQVDVQRSKDVFLGAKQGLLMFCSESRLENVM